MEQYDLAIEEEAYPFEEKAIEVHESNLTLVSRGVYNEWIEKSLRRLAESVPARYDKPEETSGIMSSLDTYVFAVVKSAPAGSAVASTSKSGPGQLSVQKSGSAGTDPDNEPDPAIEPEATEPALSDPSSSPAATDQATRR